MYFRRIDLAEAHLALDEPQRALDVLDDDFAREAYRHVAAGHPPWGLAARAVALLATGEPLDTQLFRALRGYALQNPIPYYRRDLRRVEHALGQAGTS